jgi:CDP-diglyceride synthetase
MVPIGTQLAALFQPNEFAPVFGLIWGGYLATDTAAEVFGSLFGKQTIRVRGVGDVNRKSIAGVVGGFACALILGVWIVTANGLGTSWLVLAVAVAITSTLLELYSPRGTDDFTMATGNALVCLAFGAWIR